MLSGNDILKQELRGIQGLGSFIKMLSGFKILSDERPDNFT